MSGSRSYAPGAIPGLAGPAPAVGFGHPPELEREPTRESPSSPAMLLLQRIRETALAVRRPQGGRATNLARGCHSVGPGLEANRSVLFFGRLAGPDHILSG